MKCDYCGNELKPFTKFCTRCGNPVANTAAQPVQPAQPIYTPPPAQPPPPVQPQPRTSWGAGAESAPRAAPPRRKSRAGKILLVVFGVLLVLGVGAAALGYYGFQALKGSIKSSEAYATAERELKESKRVAERMGEIRETGFPVGTYEQKADGSGSAVFTVSVEGTKASGRYFVTMDRARGAWRVTNGYVQIAGTQESISVSDESGRVTGPVVPGVPGADAPAAPPPPAPPGVKTVSGGVLNGKAKSKPEPPYPAIAKAAKAQGTVVVQVTVDESGKVISASAVSGHPLLRAAATAAARQATFEPTKLSGKPVRVTGMLTYTFALANQGQPAQ